MVSPCAAVVSIHAPAWGATCGGSQACAGAWFQSTPPRGGRPDAHRQCRSGVYGFNPRPRVGGDIRRSALQCGQLHGFNPRPRVGGDALAAEIDPDGIAVSIHAPAWGATCERRRSCTSSYCFNPRPRVGGDAEAVPDQVTYSPVSIHAPAWGATLWPLALRRQPQLSFNPRPRVGGDPIPCTSQSVARVSIHAPAWGATYCASAAARRWPGFNPRPRVGGDSRAGVAGQARQGVSIHAPAWGATPPL